MLWQHLFWFFGHPEVYIIALPFFGIVTEVLPVFSRKPIFGYNGLVFATIAIAGLSMTVWAHHMFATGEVLLPFFSFMTFLIAVPTGVKFFNWIGTMWRGSLTFETPMLLSIGFLVTFLFGGLTGVILASPPLDFQVTDTYFVVAHFHYVVFGTVVFAMFAGFYFWWPKFTGQMLDERLGKIHFWTLFIGFHTTFLVQHWLGAEGMPRRYADYLAIDGFTALNMISTIGAFLLGASTLPFLYNVIKSHERARRSRSTTRGASAARWSGRRPARRRGTTSLSCRGSARSGRRSTCTTRRSPRWTRRRRTRTCSTRPSVSRTSRAAPEVSADEGRGLAVRCRVFFFALAASIYWRARPRSRRHRALAFTAGLAFLIGYYLLFTGPAHRPRGRRTCNDAEIAEGAGELGFFSPHSWWPLPVAFFAALASSASSSAGGCSSSAPSRRARGDRVRVRVLPGRARPLRAATASPSGATGRPPAWPIRYQTSPRTIGRTAGNRSD